MSETHLSPAGAPVKAAPGWQEGEECVQVHISGAAVCSRWRIELPESCCPGFPSVALFICIMDPPAPRLLSHLHPGHRDALGVPCLGHLERHVVPWPSDKLKIL